VVRYREAIREKDKTSLVLEYVEGTSLLTYLKRQKKVSEQETKVIFRQLLSAVSYCHTEGVAHRDIKLENIIIDR